LLLLDDDADLFNGRGGIVGGGKLLIIILVALLRSARQIGVWGC
jgi:hypothetical protein